LVRSNPKDVRSASLLANTKLRIANVLVKTNKTDAALRLMLESLQSREQLAAKDPNNSGAKAEVAEAYATLGDTYLLTRRAKQARDYYERARVIYADLLNQGKLSADFRNEPERLTTAVAKLDAQGHS
jgi:tetratricopeptide (TPR) repeat protein